MSRIAGIDLGTSTSEIAILIDGKPHVIPNREGELITPSVVGVLEDGMIIAGREAREQLLLRPKDTVIEVKRLMGSGTGVVMGGKEYTPQQVSSYIIKYLVDCASEYLGERIERAVVTVPAYFSDEQRRATVEAGKLAGIKVERILNEPTAASLDYGIDHMTECRNVLVYDLGGGTLDVTVLEMFEGVLEVKASCGNNRLGGKDFDAALTDFMLERFTERTGLDVSDDSRAMMRIKEVSERCKITLSSEYEYLITLPFFANVQGNPVSLEEMITRDGFESLIADMIDSTEQQIKTALADAGLGTADLDLVLLVGGSTRIPYVRQFIRKVLQKEPETLVDPDLAVVRGAAVQAAILNEELSEGRNILITDVCPYTLGISVLGNVGGILMPDVYNVIIPRNITIPVIREKTYCTVQDNQEKIEIIAYQGDYKRASKNNLLGRFYLDGIPPAPAFKEKIKVMFSYDVNGILHVEGTVVSTGMKADISVETTGVEMSVESDPDRWKDMPGARKYRVVLNKAERIIKKEKAGVYEMEIDVLAKDIRDGLVKGCDPEALDKIKEDLEDLLLEAEEEAND